MIEKIIDTVKDNGLIEIVYILMGSMLLYLIQSVKIWFVAIRRRQKLAKALENAKQDIEEQMQVMDIANGAPKFEENNIQVRLLDKKFFIPFPESLKKALQDREAHLPTEQKSKFSDAISFNGEGDYTDIARKTGIQDIPEMIEIHSLKVAHEYIDDKNGLLFNGKKYGVDRLRFSRVGEQEKPTAEIDLFETDYFTHRVMRSIYRELKSQGHEIATVGLDDYAKYSPFFTSFGINTLLICEGTKGREIVLSKRSTRVHSTDNKSLYHITMNEGLSQTDIDPFGNVLLELCFKRGLLEELGITNELYSNKRRAAFYDFFLDRSNFELGLSSMIEMDLNFELDIRPLIARDRTLEISSFEVLPLRKSVIQKFIQQNQFVPHGLYCLKRVLMRELTYINETSK